MGYRLCCTSCNRNLSYFFKKYKVDNILLRDILKDISCKKCRLSIALLIDYESNYAKDPQDEIDLEYNIYLK